VIPFGVSSHHRHFWGTIYVRPEVLKAYVRDVCLSLKTYGVRKLLLINGHGGNTAALDELARELREKENFFIAIFQWWPLAGKLLPKIFSQEERGHAGAEETSINLFLHSHLVKMERAVDETPGWIIPTPEGFNFPLDTVDYTKSGVFGRSSIASAEKGRKVFEAVVNELVKFVEEFKNLNVEDLSSKNLV
jgi:creatinine amidohydrolase